MKILLWPCYYLPNIGGLEIMTHSLALELQNLGHTVLVISNNSNICEFNKQIIEGIPVFTFPFNEALSRGNILMIKKSLTKIDQILDEFAPNVINVHGWFEVFSFYQTRVLKNRKIPLCITIHGLLEQTHYRTLECQKLWSMAKGITTVSNALIESLKEQGITHPNLTTIYNGLSLPKFPLKALPTHPPKLVMIGRLTQEKCFDIAFYAIKSLIEKYPDLKGCLVGGGHLFHELICLKNSLGLGEVIEMTDFVIPHKVQPYLDQATIVLIPSHYESFSLTALQAAMAGRPTIASNVYGLKEVIEDGVTGILVPPKHPEALADALDHLLCNREKMEQMGKAGYLKAKNLFTIENTTQNYLRMYQKCLLSA